MHHWSFLVGLHASYSRWLAYEIASDVLAATRS